MTRYAIITGGVVENIVKASPELALEQGWIEAPIHVSPSWLFDGQSWSEPVLPPTYETASDAKAAMLAWIDAFLQQFTAGAASAEPLAWAKKEDAARAYLANTATADQITMIEVEAGVTGEAPNNLCNLIVGQAGLYTVVIAFTTGLRRKTNTAIDAAVSVDDLPAILSTAQQEAMTKAVSLNLA